MGRKGTPIPYVSFYDYKQAVEFDGKENKSSNNKARFLLNT
jgi:hypothetical protein